MIINVSLFERKALTTETFHLCSDVSDIPEETYVLLKDCELLIMVLYAYFFETLIFKTVH